MKTAVLLSLSVPLGLLLGCGSDDTEKASPDPNEGRVFSGSITAVAGGTVITEGGTASVKIPAGALPQDTEVTIGVEKSQDGTWSSVYDLGPDGTQFSMPVTISIAYDGTLGEDRKATLAWKDGSTWTPIAGSTTSGGKVSATTTHFSRFSIVILEVDRVDDPMNQGTGDEAAMTYSTWTDPTTNLMWQYPTAVNWMGWQEAVDYCARLKLDGDGWHLPTISELRTLIRNCPATQTGGACGVIDSCLEQYQCWGETGICNGCADGGCNWAPELFYEGEGSCLPPYWSSSTYTNSTWSEPPPPEEDMAWGVMFAGGAITLFDKTPSHPSQEWKVRCVRPAL